jgi:hypothetical protein
MSVYFPCLKHIDVINSKNTKRMLILFVCVNLIKFHLKDNNFSVGGRKYL